MDRDQPLYEADFYTWTQEQAAAIRRAGAQRLNADVDWENVAEEIETLGRSELRSVCSHLDTVIEHLLKLMVSPAADPRRGWRRSVGNARLSLRDELTRSLRNELERSVEARYRLARTRAVKGLLEDDLTGADLPESCPWTLDQLLDEDFWPANRHGLG